MRRSSFGNATVDRRQVLRAAGLVGLSGLAVVGGVAGGAAVADAAAFVHPGLLHTAADFDRIRRKLAAKDPTVTAGWGRLTANGRSSENWRARPLATVVRGGDGQNYPQLYFDVHAAYQNALRWRITGDVAHGNAARDILNAWSATMTTLTGNADRFLAAGIYGYQLANAAEIVRGYDGFDAGRMRDLLMRVFYPLNDQFLTSHNGACITNYWANWDLCTVASVMAIGVFADDRSLFDRAVEYFKNGPGNGSIRKAVPLRYPGGLGQWQESGRDQGHTVMGVGLMATICEMAWNQGVDLYGYDDNRFLAGAEYVARYNLGLDVPFTTFRWGTGQNCAGREQTVVSAGSRGQLRPVWEMVYNHYVQRRGLAAPNVAAMAAQVRVEGGGGDYGSASGGYDQLGFGTLLYTRDRAAAASTPASGAAPSVRASAAPSRGVAGLSSADAIIPEDSTGANGGELDLAGQQGAGRGGLGAGATAGVVGAAALVAVAAGGALVWRRRRGAGNS
ncbi:alginate lyase family protein [Dactylosporangium sp. NPDC049140]|uniref:alginate lyase family protein n=1 Tax=Dactylosporangium sp. NPDC049140 TaxID=3155647 RepID=UPI0033C6373A